MFKAQTFKATRMITVFVNKTQGGNVQLVGGPAGSEWKFSLCLQGISPEQFVAGIRKQSDMPSPSGLLAAFSLAGEEGYRDIPLDVEFTEDGRVILTSEKVKMVFRWSDKLYHLKPTKGTSYTEDVSGEEMAVTYGILVEGDWPEAALKLAEPAAKPRPLYKGAARRAVRQTTPRDDDNVEDKEIPF